MESKFTNISLCFGSLNGIMNGLCGYRFCKTLNFLKGDWMKKYLLDRLFLTKRLFQLSEDEIIVFGEFFLHVLENTDLRKMKEYIQHGNTDTLLHSVAVAHFSYLLAKALRINIRLRPLIVGALLHDYYLYDWHVPDRSHNWHGFRHPFTSAKNAHAHYSISHIEEDIILRHMFPLIPIPPRYRESAIVCLVDKICSVYETFSKSPYESLPHKKMF